VRAAGVLRHPRKEDRCAARRARSNEEAKVATVTKTTVEVAVGQYTYRAELDGNAVDLYRDGAYAGKATWGGKHLEDFPKVLSTDAEDRLNAAILQNLQKAWRAAPNAEGDDRDNANGPLYETAPDAPSPDAGNTGQMGNETKKPSRQGEKEVGTGGPGGDPNTGEVGGQAVKPHRRAIGDGFRPPPDRSKRS
jgi:hypothetical protein